MGNWAFCGMLALLALTPAGYATSLSPGGCVGIGTVSCPGSVQDFAGAGISITGPSVMADTGNLAFTGLNATNNTVYTGDLRELVVTDSLTGNLDFIYMIAVTGGPDAVGRMTTTNYTGFTTDVGYSSTPTTDLLGLGDTPAVAPDDISRGSGGNTVAFNFNIPSEHLATGQETFLLVVKTNATTWGAGSTQVIDGGIATVQTFAPTTPEPALAGVLLGGLFGAGLLITHRFRARRQSKI